MSNWLNYLVANPVLALALVIVLVLFIFMVLRKLIKWALISFVVLVIAVSFTYNDSQKPDVIDKIKEKTGEIADKIKEKTKEKAGKKIEEATEKAIDDIKEQINSKTE